MNLKYNMQHDQTAELYTCKSQLGRESKMAADTKNSKTIKIIFFSRMAWYIWLKFCLLIRGTLVLRDIKMKKQSVAKKGHNDRLKIYVDPSKINVDPDFKAYLNGLFSETTLLMVLKFHMQHD